MKTTKVNVVLAGFILMLLYTASVLYAAESPAAGPAKSPATGPAESPATGPAPVAVMPETAFEFPPTVEGESITHDFLIQNKGDAVLTILDVKTT